MRRKHPNSGNDSEVVRLLRARLTRIEDTLAATESLLQEVEAQFYRADPHETVDPLPVTTALSPILNRLHRAVEDLHDLAAADDVTRYTVTLTRKQSTEIEVWGETPEDAEDAAREALERGDIEDYEWSDDDLEVASSEETD